MPYECIQSILLLLLLSSFVTGKLLAIFTRYIKHTDAKISISKNASLCRVFADQVKFVTAHLATVQLDLQLPFNRRKSWQISMNLSRFNPSNWISTSKTKLFCMFRFNGLTGSNASGGSNGDSLVGLRYKFWFWNQMSNGDSNDIQWIMWQQNGDPFLKFGISTSGIKLHCFFIALNR